jgi:hypothetical protein
MKKMDYFAPEMEIIELKNKVAILAGSDPGEAPGGGGDDD